MTSDINQLSYQEIMRRLNPFTRARAPTDGPCRCSARARPIACIGGCEKICQRLVNERGAV